MIDKNDRDLFWKVLFGSSVNVDEKYEMLKKNQPIVGFLYKFLYLSDPQELMSDSSGDCSVDFYEEDGIMSLVVKKYDNLYYISRGTAVKIGENGLFEQINLNGNNIENYRLEASKENDCLYVSVNSKGKQSFDSRKRRTTVSTSIPCDASNVLGKLKVAPFTQKQFFDFISENINLSELERFRDRTSVFTSSCGDVSLNIAKFSSQYSYTCSSGFSVDRIGRDKTDNEAIEEIKSKYLSDETLNHSAKLFEYFCQIDPAMILISKKMEKEETKDKESEETEKMKNEETGLLGNNLDALMSADRVASNKSNKEF